MYIVWFTVRVIRKLLTIRGGGGGGGGVCASFPFVLDSGM